MAISGIFLKGNNARIITLNGTKSKHSLIDTVNKLSLPKNPTQEDVKLFSQAFNDFCSDNSIEKIIINRRGVKGKGKGGSATFIIEGILLATSNVPIEFFHPATVRATDRRELHLKASRPETVDLAKAYDYGYEGLAE